MIESRESRALLTLIPGETHPHMCMAKIRRNPHIGDIHDRQPRIFHFKTDDLGEFFADCLRYPLCAMLIHIVK